MATARAAGNIDALLLKSPHISPSQGILKLLACQDTVIHGTSNSFWMIDIMETAQRNNYGTLLTGEHGNAGISYTGLNYLLPFWHSAHLSQPRLLLSAKVKRPFMRAYFPHYYNKGIEAYILQKGYLQPHIIQEYNIINDIRQNKKGFKKRFNNASEGMLAILMPGFNGRCLFGAGMKHFYGVDKRDPTADKRVLEYCLSIPNEAFFDNKGNNKMILKRMMQNRLPNEVLFEKKKGLQASDIVYRVLAEQKAITELIHTICENDLFKEIVNTTKLKSDWQKVTALTYKNKLQISIILKTVMVGCFFENNKLKG